MHLCARVGFLAGNGGQDLLVGQVLVPGDPHCRPSKLGAFLVLSFYYKGVLQYTVVQSPIL
jgi:hypothetical protein